MIELNQIIDIAESDKISENLKVGLMLTLAKQAIEREEAVSSQWQSIDTAPKDDTKILLGRFVDYCPNGKNGLIKVDRWHTTGAYIGFGNFNSQYWPATHWQPLPAPPQEGKA